MRCSIGGYQAVIRDTIEMGRCLGDAFAWLMLCKERAILDKHLERKRVVNFPTGIGGFGELTFIKNVNSLDNHFSLYHSITNILRIGDVSLIKLDDMSLTAIGEIKTLRKNEDTKTLEMQLYMVGPALNNFIKATKSKRPAKESAVLPAGMQDRLKRQMRGMCDAFKAGSPPKASLMVENKTQFGELSKVILGCKPMKPVYRKMSDGLLLVAVRDKSRSLSDFFLNETDFSKSLTGVSDAALDILDASSQDNSVYLGNVLYNKDNSAAVCPGMRPVFWWPVDIEALRMLYFHEVVVVTAFNPVHIMNKLQSLGYEVEHDNRRKPNLRARKRHKDGWINLMNLDYYLLLVSSLHFSEEAIVEMIKRTAEEAEKAGLGPNTRVDIRIGQR